MPTCSTTAINVSHPGTFPTTCAKADSTNYTFTYTDGTYVVSKAPLVLVPSAKVHLGHLPKKFTFAGADFQIRTGPPSLGEHTAAILAEEMGKGAFPALIHCFTASADFARQMLDLGLTISLSGIVTFKNAKDLQAIAIEIPEDRLLVETDAPFLAPIPHRGQVCEPGFTADTARFVAGLRGVEVEALGEATTRNFFRLFTKAKA